MHCQSEMSWGRWHRLQRKTCQSKTGEESIKRTTVWSQKVFLFRHKMKSKILPYSASKWKIKADSRHHCIATNEGAILSFHSNFNKNMRTWKGTARRYSLPVKF